MCQISISHRGINEQQVLPGYCACRSDAITGLCQKTAGLTARGSLFGAGYRTRTYDACYGTAYKTVAIAAMRNQHCLVRAGGFEPPTYHLESDRSAIEEFD